MEQRPPVVDGLVLGDSGYPVRTWLMTPLGQPVGNQQMNFNNSHRQKLKEKGYASSPVPKSKTSHKQQPTQTRASAKLLEQKQAHTREQARNPQARHRAKVRANLQKFRRVKERRRRRYHEQKQDKRLGTSKSQTKKATWRAILSDVSKKLDKCRSKLSLIKHDFLKNNLARKTESETKTYYVRKKRQASRNLVWRFLNEVAVDNPATRNRNRSKPKKVVTKTMNDLYLDFISRHPELKIRFQL
ncbi:hypothetical protein ElyMa_001628000 [Elysia marginata]|uniref:DDE Tnp4 domain-containing protein n=1 Tax=Elysia marginata TaxID=1093978 RepID=A0AAV4JJU0_9GAST|nr:hypothetical protein ElyMa_001628000 [Elysia marginata]